MCHRSLPQYGGVIAWIGGTNRGMGKADSWMESVVFGVTVICGGFVFWSRWTNKAVSG